MSNLNESNIALIFDLDYTIWPFWVDTHITPPFIKESDNLLKDSNNYKIQLYKDVKEIFDKLNKRGYILCSISRTWEPEYAKQLIKLFDLEKYLKYIIFDTGSKINGIKTIVRKENLKGMNYCALFDDESRNIEDARRNDVFAIHIDENYGITKKIVNDNLKKLHKNLGIIFNDIF